MYRTTTINNQTRQQLIDLAYDAIGYSPTRDSYVINDRIAALEKLSDKELLAIIETRTPKIMKCQECNGTGERNGNSEGMDHPVVCCFCEGTGVEDEATQKLIITMNQKKSALENAISIVEFERRDFKVTISNLKLLLADLENQIEEIRNRE